MIVALVLSALVAAESPASSNLEARPACFQDPRALEKHRYTWNRMQEAAASQEPSYIAAAAGPLRKLLALPAFRTRTGEPAVAATANDPALLDWWDRGGDDWIASVLMHEEVPVVERKVVIPPTMRSVVDPKRVPAEFICAKGPCDREAEHFMTDRARPALLLEAYRIGRAHGAYTAHPGAIGRGPHVHFTPLAYRCPEVTYEHWEACVMTRRSIRAEFPIGNYRIPRSGWLFIERSGQLRTQCPHFTAIDLATGAAIWIRDCEILWGRGDRQRAREFALIAALARSVEEVVDYQEINVPRHLAGEARCSLSSTVTEPYSSSHNLMSVWWWNEGPMVLDISVSTYQPGRPGARLASGLFWSVQRTLRAGGDAPQVPEVGTVGDDDFNELLRSIRPGLGVMRTE